MLLLLLWTLVVDRYVSALTDNTFEVTAAVLKLLQLMGKVLHWTILMKDDC